MIDEPLNAYFPRLKETQAKALFRLGIKTTRELLYYFPARYESFSGRTNISDLKEGDKATVSGKIIETSVEKTKRKKINISSAIVADVSGAVEAVWFNQPYATKLLKIGDKVILTGKVTNGKRGLYIANPNYEKVSEYENLGKGNGFVAVYPETKGISSLWLRFAIKRVLTKSLAETHDHLPKEILEKYHLPSVQTALVWIHIPQKLKDAESARKRFAFEEVFFIQLARQKERILADKSPTYNLTTPKKELEDFLKTFPFSLTGAQKKAIEEINKDMSSGKPMSRLLEGDVGSGKTAVAVAASYLAVRNSYQVAYMAPTEILAGQHFQSFIDYFSQLRLTTKIGLITSSGCYKYPSKIKTSEATAISRNQLLKWVASGEIPILIGTHAIIQKSISFGKLALAIVDEQHRFGVKQRSALLRGRVRNELDIQRVVYDTARDNLSSVSRSSASISQALRLPHFLSMTATPIPRTLALTIYGDLDLSVLDELPKGRKEIKTEIVPPEERPLAYEEIRRELKIGRQAYVICPRINEPDPAKENALNTKSVIAEAKFLGEKVFKEFMVGMLHGKMTSKEKDEVLTAFNKKEIDILVATSVVEVGINVPNATMIVIEGAERFGLAQLHQLRGRVMRSSYQPFCYVFTESNSKNTLERLKALVSAKNGFELAEYDLKFRGAGNLDGVKQWGISDVGMEAIKNIRMVEAAREEAKLILSNDPELEKNKPLLQIIEKRHKEIHFE